MDNRVSVIVWNGATDKKMHVTVPEHGTLSDLYDEVGRRAVLPTSSFWLFREPYDLPVPDVRDRPLSDLWGPFDEMRIVEFRSLATGPFLQPMNLAARKP